MKYFRCGKHNDYARECRSTNYGKAGHIAKFYRTKEMEKNLQIEEDDEEKIWILMMMQNLDAELKSCKLEAEWCLAV